MIGRTNAGGGGGGAGSSTKYAISVNYPAGSTLVCEGNGKTFRAKNSIGIATFYPKEAGTYTITATLDDKSASQEFTISDENPTVFYSITYVLPYFVRGGQSTVEWTCSTLSWVSGALELRHASGVTGWGYFTLRNVDLYKTVNYALGAISVDEGYVEIWDLDHNHQYLSAGRGKANAWNAIDVSNLGIIGDVEFVFNFRGRYSSSGVGGSYIRINDMWGDPK